MAASASAGICGFQSLRSMSAPSSYAHHRVYSRGGASTVGLVNGQGGVNSQGCPAERAGRVHAQPAVDAGLVEDMAALRQLPHLLPSRESLQANRALAHLGGNSTINHPH